jgi:hypothetical protein
LNAPPTVSQILRVRDKAKLLRFLEREPNLHFYEIGDLDGSVWSHTEWFALRSPPPAR